MNDNNTADVNIVKGLQEENKVLQEQLEAARGQDKMLRELSDVLQRVLSTTPELPETSASEILPTNRKRKRKRTARDREVEELQRKYAKVLADSVTTQGVIQTLKDENERLRALVPEEQLTKRPSRRRQPRLPFQFLLDIVLDKENDRENIISYIYGDMTVRVLLFCMDPITKQEFREMVCTAIDALKTLFMHKQFALRSNQEYLQFLKEGVIQYTHTTPLLTAREWLYHSLLFVEKEYGHDQQYVKSGNGPCLLKWNNRPWRHHEYLMVMTAIVTDLSTLMRYVDRLLSLNNDVLPDVLVKHFFPMFRL